MHADHVNPDVHWADEPLDGTIEDDLGRGAFVRTVAGQIDRASGSDPSTVFGLVGEWGSGKTSIIRQIKNEVQTDWVIADFTPWSSGDASAMSFEFVATLADALGVAAAGQARERFARYAGFITPFLNAIPFAGAGASASASELLSALATRPPWHKQFEELSETVAAAQVRVLIVIDDVDRLGGAELINLLRVVRLLGRFQGVHYLIAYDQATIEDLLATAGSAGRAATFMEKIVQYPFEVPPVSRAAALRLTHRTVFRLLEATGSHLDDVGMQRETDLVRVLAKLMRTPRTIGRFSSQLLAFSEHVRDAELDVLDYVAVTWLRLESHAVWALLPRWRSELNTGSRSIGLLESEKIPFEEWLKRIHSVQPAGNPADVAEVLELMFPGISSTDVSTYYEHPRSVADEAYFGRYILLALPEDDVSDALIAEVIEGLASHGESARTLELTALLDGADDIANLAIARALKIRREADTTSRELVDYLIARWAARSEDLGPVAPRTALTPLIAREMVLSLEGGQYSAAELIRAVGEKESFTFVLHFRIVLRDRERAKTAADGFGQYWLAAAAARTAELLSQPELVSTAIELIAWTQGVDRIRGVFDNEIVDLDSYVRVATAFVRFNRWVGGDVTYEMTFSQDAFEAIVRPETRAQYAAAVSAARTGLDYESDDLPDPEVSDAVLREFVLDSIHRTSAT